MRFSQLTSKLTVKIPTYSNNTVEKPGSHISGEGWWGASVVVQPQPQGREMYERVNQWEHETNMGTLKELDHTQLCWKVSEAGEPGKIYFFYEALDIKE